MIEFQDKKNLYFIMEYVPGGDLMEKLIRDEKFDEDLARYALLIGIPLICSRISDCSQHPESTREMG